jgi:ADP-heptose:LPS heptosyltransferase
MWRRPGVAEKTFSSSLLSSYTIEVLLGDEQNESHDQDHLIDQYSNIKLAIAALENACTPFGFFAEPIPCEKKSKLIAELKFIHPIPKESPHIEKLPVETSSSFCITLSMVEDDADEVQSGQDGQISRTPQRIILRSFLSPGDILMLTAAVRDLHRCCPDQFIIDVRTPCDALWENNPHLTSLNEYDVNVKMIDCEYPLVHQSNQRPFHFIHGYAHFLRKELGEDVVSSDFCGDLHLSDSETKCPFLNDAHNPDGLPVWIICAGGKFDYTIKWWHWRKYQEVINHFKDKILFVQVGEEGHFHPPLKNVVDMRGKTSLREMVHLMHWADGLLCGVTFHMHLAAAVPLRANQMSRPAIIIAGGREAPHWEAYPTHQFLHTVGMLPCCAKGGCWKARTLPLGDGDIKDEEQNLCVDVVNGLPHCMDMITVDQVCHHVAMAYAGTQKQKRNQ